MYGLIIKDLFNLKKIKNTYFILVAIIVAYCFVAKRYNFIVAVPVLIFSATITSTFVMDKSVKWDKLAIPGVLNRGQIVKSKYLLLIILIIFGLLIGLLLSLPSIIIQNINYKVFIEMSMFGAGMSLCAGSLSLGFVYIAKNATDKIEILTLFSYAGAVAITFGIIRLINELMNINELSTLLINLLIIAIIFLVSYKLSLKSFNKRDLN